MHICSLWAMWKSTPLAMLAVRDLVVGLDLRWHKSWIAALSWVCPLSSHCQAWASLSMKTLIKSLHTGHTWSINPLPGMSVGLWCDFREVLLQKSVYCRVFCWSGLLLERNQAQSERTANSYPQFSDKVVMERISGVVWHENYLLFVFLLLSGAVTLLPMCLSV